MTGADWPSIAIILAQCLVVAMGGLVHGTLGIGFPLLATPLLALFTDVRTAVLVLLIPTMAINVASILKGGGWRISIGGHWPLAVYAVVGTVLGTRLLIQTDPAPYKLLMAAVLLLYLNVHRFGIRMAWVQRYRWTAFAVFGMAAGLLAGTVNAMLPALIIYALEIGLRPTAMVQVFNFCFLTGKITQAATFGVAGLFTRPVIVESLPLAAIALIALTVGMALRSRIPEATYRQWLRKALFGIAVLLAGQFVFGR